MINSLLTGQKYFYRSGWHFLDKSAYQFLISKAWISWKCGILHYVAGFSLKFYIATACAFLAAFWKQL